VKQITVNTSVDTKFLKFKRSNDDPELVEMHLLVHTDSPATLTAYLSVAREALANFSRQNHPNNPNHTQNSENKGKLSNFLSRRLKKSRKASSQQALGQIELVSPTNNEQKSAVIPTTPSDTNLSAQFHSILASPPSNFHEILPTVALEPGLNQKITVLLPKSSLITAANDPARYPIVLTVQNNGKEGAERPQNQLIQLSFIEIKQYSPNSPISPASPPANQSPDSLIDGLLGRFRWENQFLWLSEGGILLEQAELYDADEENAECIVCLSELRDILLLPCRHWAVCHNCYSGLRKCLICRAPIYEFMQFSGLGGSGSSAEAVKEARKLSQSGRSSSSSSADQRVIQIEREEKKYQ
jgi:hypothetical protein